jgi:hypothetical protein
MQFQLSVFYENAFLSYVITTEDKATFTFNLKSKPSGNPYAPPHFIVTRLEDKWTFDGELETGFKKSVISTLKKAKV